MNLILVIFLGGAIAPSPEPLPAAVSEIVVNFHDGCACFSQANKLTRYPEPVPPLCFPKETPWLEEQRRLGKSTRSRFYHDWHNSPRYLSANQQRQFLRSKKPAV